MFWRERPPYAILRRMKTALFDDGEFSRNLVRLAVPIATQSLVMNALNAVDVLMIGQLGETAIAAVGLAGQVFFLMSLFLFGVGSGSAIFSAQFWGREDVPNVRRVLGLALLLGIGGSTLFSLVAIFAPSAVLALYSHDPAVIEAGSRYLRVVGLCYVPTAISIVFAMVLRSVRQVKAPMFVSILALSLKTVLAYALIFGHFGAPAMGIMGAAVATVIARLVECGLILALTYHFQLPAAARPAELFDIDRDLVGRFFRTSAPVVLGEVLWSLGITVYSGIYARIGTEAIAATNIASTIESVAMVPLFGIGNAAAILLGNRIGAGRADGALRDARRLLLLAVALGAGMGALILLVRGPLLTLYRISPEAQGYARSVLLILACALWIKAANLMMIVGILRSGGDTRFALAADTGPLWLIGIPMALLGAFVLHLPVYWVVLMVMSDEIVKFVIGTLRVRSGRWIHNVVQSIPQAEG